MIVSEAARAYGVQVMDYLQENPRLFGAEHPTRTFRFSWKEWLGLDETGAADEVLALATI